MIAFFRIFFTLLSVLCVAAVIPVGIFGGWLWAVICILGAFAFYLLMLICKQAMDKNAPSPQNEEKSVSEKENKNENNG